MRQDQEHPNVCSFSMLFPFAIQVLAEAFSKLPAIFQKSEMIFPGCSLIFLQVNSQLTIPQTAPEWMIPAGDGWIFKATVTANLSSCFNSHLHSWDQGVVWCQLHFCLPHRVRWLKTNFLPPQKKMWKTVVFLGKVICLLLAKCECEWRLRRWWHQKKKRMAPTTNTTNLALLTTNHSRPVQPPLTLSASDQSKTLIMPRTGIWCLRWKCWKMTPQLILTIPTYPNVNPNVWRCETIKVCHLIKGPG